MSRQSTPSPQPKPPEERAAPQRGWAATRWLRAVEAQTPPNNLAEGAQLSRSRRLSRPSLGPGRASSTVRERSRIVATPSLSITAYPHELWERAVAAMAEQTVLAAKILAGELPQAIEDAFAPLGSPLFPDGGEPIAPRCTCHSEEPWCVHVCALAHAVADILEKDPFVIFALRGTPAADLVERLRQRRAVDEASGAEAPAYSQRPVPSAEKPAAPLETTLDSFWRAGPALSRVETPLTPPTVTHALLKRLGPSPFEKARFPIVGLLATCYDAISARALDATQDDARSDSDENDPAYESA